ncbi:MAG: 50S ribosomal protein L17 [Candidatus Margulisiibacteriota bacterium]
MRHRKGNAKLGLPTDQRLALIRNGARSLLIHKQVQTTDRRAHEISKYVEKMITVAKANTVFSRREVLKFVSDKEVLKILFSPEMLEKYSSIKGGYTRIIKSGIRRGDAASVSVLELI